MTLHRLLYQALIEANEKQGFESVTRHIQNALDAMKEVLLSSMLPPCSSSNSSASKSVSLLKSQSKTVDPLFALPAEIMMRIFYFTPESRIQCLCLSKAWHHKLLSMPVWDNLTLRIDREWFEPHQIFKNNTRFLGPDLRHLILKTDAPLWSAIQVLFQSGCDHIHRLELHDSYMPKIFIMLERPSLLQDLAPCIVQLGKQLTDLRIYSNLQMSNALRLILTCFPSLETLIYDCHDGSTDMMEDNRYGISTWEWSSLGSLQKTRLQRLEWTGGIEILDDGGLLQYCPRLIYFLFRHIRYGYYFPDAHGVGFLMSNLQRWCPRLEAIVLCNRYIDRLRPELGYQPSACTMAETSPGLKRLALLGLCDISQAELQTYIHEYQDTLELLEYRLSYVRNEGMDEDSIHDQQSTAWMPPTCLAQLHTLIIAHNCYVPAAFQPLHTFLRTCPVLSHLHLAFDAMEPQGEHDLAQALVAAVELPFLQHVEFEALVSLPPWLAFLRAAVAQGSVCAIQSLVVQGALAEVVWDNSALSLLAQLMTLRQLHVSDVRMDQQQMKLSEADPTCTFTEEKARMFADTALCSGMVDRMEDLLLELDIPMTSDAWYIMKAAFSCAWKTPFSPESHRHEPPFPTCSIM